MKKGILVKTNFVAFHRWKDAPDEVGFLRDYHRHIFYVEATFQVSHNDRDLEFFTVKKDIDTFIASNYKNKKFDKSCEQIAEEILNNYGDCIRVEVYEDNENGGYVEA